jgi:hypothetical protein
MCETLGGFLHKAILRSGKKWFGQVWWYMPVIPALRRWRQEDREFQTNLGYMARPYLKKKQKTLSVRLPSCLFILGNICEIKVTSKDWSWCPLLQEQPRCPGRNDNHSSGS